METSDREKLARQWVELVKSVPEINYGPEANAAADLVMAHTAPPTMADVEWDHDTMPGTGALTVNGRLWIMRDDAGDAIDCISTDLAEIAFVAKEGLTPNGKRYELREIKEPDHPEVLETVEDYENAPEGTVVSGDSGIIWAKVASGEWTTLRSARARMDRHMADTERHVLRRGWGDEA